MAWQVAGLFWTLEHYVHEEASVAVLASLPSNALSTVRLFAACSELLLDAVPEAPSSEGVDGLFRQWLL